MTGGVESRKHERRFDKDEQVKRDICICADYRNFDDERNGLYEKE